MRDRNYQAIIFRQAVGEVKDLRIKKGPKPSCLEPREHS